MKVHLAEEIDYEGTYIDEFDLETVNKYDLETLMKMLARGRMYLVELPDPTVKRLGKKAFKIFKEEVDKIEATKAKRKASALARKKKENE